MAKISTLRLLRARFSGGCPRLALLLVLFASDLVELGASIALALASPPPARPPSPYPAVDLPTPAAPPLALGLSIALVTAGLLWGAAIVYEMVVLFRRSQIHRWRRARVRLAAA